MKCSILKFFITCDKKLKNEKKLIFFKKNVKVQKHILKYYFLNKPRQLLQFSTEEARYHAFIRNQHEMFDFKIFYYM
jgi:16S rRNA U516 pseudouridylate synthase RsuA-like enzyme